MAINISGWFIILAFYLIINATFALRIPGKRGDQLAKGPICEPDSVCGVVQVNSRGLTAYPICSCPESMGECPLVWDSGDGKSVNQGPMQYKHCGPAPRKLSPCIPDQTAYTMTIITPLEAEDTTMKISHKIHCKCPENYKHTSKGEHSEIIPFVGEANSYLLTCAPYPICEEDDACKTLSETRTEFLENKMCRCPVGTHCPVLGNRKAKVMEFGRGKITQLLCQR